MEKTDKVQDKDKAQDKVEERGWVTVGNTDNKRKIENNSIYKQH